MVTVTRKWVGATRKRYVKNTLRDRDNVSKTVRTVLDDAGMPWATASTFRTAVGDLVTKTVNGTAAANVLGHARTSMTCDRDSDRR